MKTNINLLFFESELWEKGITFIAGVDEAGRGPLAGPVVAAAVALRNSQLDIPQVYDSKQLSAKKRIKLKDEIISNRNFIVSIAEISAKEIDEINILKATHKAMASALAKIAGVQFALIDGLPVKGLPCPHKAIVKGDSKSALIAAASIIAKVHRDELMDKFAEIYPEYGFNKHKGYGTREHIEALKKYGPSPIHRKSFEPIKSIFFQNDLFPHL
ncbi:MAG TPA: ribonuclease HII [Victivallales bacterium]|nr:ribonuclease HII [Victivallales bacterium]HPO89956.1 ribonuclease HII [Victivallales bacterium]HRR05666.1 ribonuclease HII [Victivallales bacterium]HRU00652.1 ribonuclease HII [Victivallales bacterium]